MGSGAYRCHVGKLIGAMLVISGTKQDRPPSSRPMKKPQPKLDPQQIYLQGCRFQFASERLRDAKHLQPGDFELVAHPSLMLSAFASELYLKCLICIETGNAPDAEHSLKKLFQQVNRRHQSQIEGGWDVLMQKPDMVRTLAQIEARWHGVKVPRDLAWALDAGSHGFVQIRYIYEPKGAQTKFLLVDFPQILRAVILQVKPGWKSLRF
jgi:hypothetical protein